MIASPAARLVLREDMTIYQAPSQKEQLLAAPGTNESLGRYRDMPPFARRGGVITDVNASPSNKAKASAWPRPDF